MATYISTSDAAKLMDVSTVTIQSLCKKGKVVYQKQGKGYMIELDSLKQYYKAQHTIIPARDNLEDYVIDWEQHLVERKKYKDMLENYPYYFASFKELTKSMDELCLLHAETRLFPRGYLILSNVWNGKSLAEVAETIALSRERVRQIYAKSLRLCLRM